VQQAQVTITQRKRGSPLDAIVSEMMLLANSTWAGWLGSLSVPGMFRGMRFGKVKMTTTPMAHESIGVAHYGWFTSPLRRYSDLVNQWQLIACIQHGTLAALQAPFKVKDPELYGLVTGFEEQYQAYNAHQNSMERYWCLRWLAQHGHRSGEVRAYDAVAVRPDAVRLRQIPLYLPLPTPLPDGARGRSVVVEIMGWDELDLSVQSRYAGEGTTGDAAQSVGVDSLEPMDDLGDDLEDEPLQSAVVVLPDAD